MNRKILALLATAAMSVTLAPAAIAQSAAAKPMYGTWGYSPIAMDTSVKPGDDFWAYVNGGWDKATPIAADRSSAGVGVTISERNEAQLRAIVDELAASPGGSGVARQIGDFYGSWMDVAALDRLGAAPLKPYLGDIAKVGSRQQLLALFMRPGFASPVDVGIIPDLKDPTRYSTAAGQASLGLPGRDYYLSKDAKMVAHRAAYRDYIVKIQQIAGLAGGTAAADRIIALETALAESQWTPERSRDIDAINNPMTKAEMSALAPQFDWTRTLAGMGLGSATSTIVVQPSAIAAAGKLVESVPLSTWKEWMAFRFASDHASNLSTAFDDARFGFYSTQLNGVQKQRDRWKRGVALIDGVLGEGLGQVYIERHYPPTSDTQMKELIANLRESYAERIASNAWMDEATRKEALAKLAAFDPRIGHPEKYIDYSTMDVVRGDLLGNAIRAGEFGWKLQLSRFAKPVDRSLWSMSPQTVNAYYSSLTNQITFPAGILQAPLFDPNADPAANYGSIGAVIGHEIGHGFDDQGRKFDGSGKVRDWWTAGAAKAYAARTDVLGAQYSKYEAVPGHFVNGKLTMGENIGDLGGVETAFAAYRKYVERHGEPPVIEGLTGNQRFFIAYAQAWQSKRRDGAMIQQLLTDPHSPPKYRVNGVVRNVDAWYEAFNIQPGDKMYLPPEQRVHIW